MSFTEFDLLTSPITGNTIIEASAGTGKTYSIEGIYIRFLLQAFENGTIIPEKRLEVKNILVVTYTEAATAELHERILQKVQNTLLGFEQIQRHQSQLKNITKNEAQSSILNVGDELLEELILSYCFDEMDLLFSEQYITDIIDHLKLAVFSFDEAAIFTIHAFCRRLLTDYSLETKVGTEFEMLKDQGELIDGCVNDFWRNQVYGGDSPYSRFFIETFPTPGDIKTYFNKVATRRDVTIHPTPTQSGEEWFKEMELEFQHLKSHWEKEKSALKTLLQSHEGDLNKTYWKNVIPSLDVIDRFFKSDAPLGAHNLKVKSTVIGMNWFFPEKLEAKTKKGKLTPNHPLFEAFELYSDRVEKPKGKLAATFVQTLIKHLDKKKKELGLTSFDDLLLLVQKALTSVETGASLAEKVRNRFKAALIDEFQDTDPVQYGIFHQLFHDHCPLFFIGDPKQSIYNFRGADLFSYFKAVQNASNRQLLKTNWRSDRDLVSAINTIFRGEQQSDQFLYEKQITFTPSKGAETKPVRSFIINGDTPSPFTFWISDGDEEISIGTARQKIMDATVAEIVRLLNAGHIGNAGFDTSLESGGATDTDIRPVQPKDIAILVRKHREAQAFQTALLEKGIPSVMKTTESIFNTDDFSQMLLLLQGICFYNKESRVKAALLTDFFQFTGTGLFELSQDENRWEQVINQFREYHDLWIRKGFYAMIRHFMKNQNLRSKILACEGGERKLTNILQIIEILHKVQLEKKLNISGSIRWMQHMQENAENGEENEIRLETDQDALKIMTLHASKGLEFPIVFCPSSWELGQADKNGTYYHDPDKDHQMTLDFMEEEKGKELAKEERLAEEIRLAYVAFTRAKHLCYTAWCDKIKSSAHFNAKNSCYHHLFLRNQPQNESCQSAFQNLQNRSNGTIQVLELPERTDEIFQGGLCTEEKLERKIFSRILKKSFGVYSFSGLNKRLEQIDVENENDEIIEKPDESEDVTIPGESKEITIHTFPGGTQTGNFFHDILEHCSFANTSAKELSTLAEEKATQYQIDEKWLTTAIEQVEHIRTLPFKSPYEADKTFSFSILPDHQVLKEMEFFFSINNFDQTSLSQVVQKHRGKGLDTILDLLEKIGRTELKGFMTGFIDMIFCHNNRYYILDWKSNKLGPDIGFYTHDYLVESIEHSHYNLQYLIYTVALHKYLKNRLAGYDFEKHFGGVYYIYLRGIENDSTANGVFYDSLQNVKELIKDLAELF